jgi:TRAP-type C4-dicarboxylate transport system permease small subunit
MRGEVGRVGLIMDRCLGYISNFCLVIAGFTIAMMVLVTTYGVAKRYVFHSPDDNVYLISCILMLGSAVFAFAEVERLKKNITVDFVSQYIPQKIRGPLLNIGGPLLGLIFCVTMVWRSWVEAWFAMQSHQLTVTIITIPTFPFQMSIAFGAGLLCLVMIFSLVRYLVSLIEKRQEATTA